MFSIADWLSSHENILAALASLVTVVSFVCSIFSFIQARSSNRKSDAAQKKADEFQNELNRIKEYFDACEQYGKVKERIRDCEKSAYKLLVIFERRKEIYDKQKNDGKQNKQQDKQQDKHQENQQERQQDKQKDDEIKIDYETKLAFYEARTNYQSLFNEMNSFSALINNGVIKADNYMENTAIPTLKKYALYQARIFKALNVYSVSLKQGKLPQPDYSAFKEYDKFLREYMTEREYEKVKEKRRNAGLRI